MLELTVTAAGRYHVPPICWKPVTTSVVQELMGHKDVETTMIYAHLTNNSLAAIRSPADALDGESGFGAVTNRVPE